MHWLVKPPPPEQRARAGRLTPVQVRERCFTSLTLTPSSRLPVITPPPARAAHLPAQLTALEELWRSQPEASLDDVARPGGADEGGVAVTPVALRYKDGDEYFVSVCVCVCMCVHACTCLRMCACIGVFHLV